jgi:hypothetical protein
MSAKLPTVTFLNEPCTMELNLYRDNNAVAVQLYCEEGPMGTSTVNIPEIRLKENEILIKDYSENEGMSQAFVEAGLGKVSQYGTIGHGAQIAIFEVTHPDLLQAMAETRKKYLEAPKKKPSPRPTEPGMDMG